MPLVPVEATRRVVELRPVEEGVDDRDRQRVVELLGLGADEFPIAVEGDLLVGAEVVLLRSDLAVPGAAGLLEERLGKMRHGANLPIDGPEGSRVPWERCESRPGHQLLVQFLVHTRYEPFYADVSPCETSEGDGTRTRNHRIDRR